METIFYKTVPISQVASTVETILTDRYQIKNSNLVNSIERLKTYLKPFRSDLFVVIEHPYVDKTYRDTYYNYYASKNHSYHRNSIRLSLLNENLPDEVFRSRADYQKVKDSYLGFIILRPTFPAIVGRSLVSPKALQNMNIAICDVSYPATVNGLKVNVNGFPHSSQDSEAITCAETTLWSLMEYFGNRYAEYTPILPSEVNRILGKFSFERLLPSKGLQAGQISFALKEIGFGVRIYGKQQYKDDFFRMLRTYVESGIPVVGVLQNNQGIGHALNIIGRNRLNEHTDLTALPEIAQINGQKVSDMADLDLEYVMIDDNYPPYQTAQLTTPVSYYTNPRWTGCELTYFIVPLYHKIYMEANEARRTSLGLISSLANDINSPVLIRTLLASSRSFKDSVALNEELNKDAKELLISTPMPKFVYITEVSTQQQLLDHKAMGMVILDATEPKGTGIIAAMLGGQYLAHDLTSLTAINLNLSPFSTYQSNLR